jgi:Na+-translocating ferredoxin:NAD+ oxidoreductase RnfE subunit
MNEKSDFGKRMKLILGLVVVNSVVMYYAEYFKSFGGYFSEGILVGFLYGIVFCLSITILGLFGYMVYKEVTTRWKGKKLKEALGE